MKKDIQNWAAKTKEFCRSDNKIAYRQLASTLLIAIGLLTASHFLMTAPLAYYWKFFGFLEVSWLEMIPVVVSIISGIFLARVFAIQHDCAHDSFTSSSRQNARIGFGLSLLTTIPFYSWSVSHMFHHKHNEKIELTDIGDIKTITVEEYRNRSSFGRLRYRLFRFAMVSGLGGVLYVLWYQRFPMTSIKFLGPLSESARSQEWKKIKEAKKSYLTTNISLLVLYSIGFWFLGWSFLFTQFLIISSFSIFAVWFFYVQHQYEDAYKASMKEWNYVDAALKGSSHYKLPWLFNYLTCDIGLHFIHHLNPKVPNYKLRKCYLANKEDFDREVYTITLRTGLRSVFLHLYDDKKKKMISFRRYRKVYA